MHMQLLEGPITVINTCSYVRMLKNSLVRKNTTNLLNIRIHGDPYVFDIELSTDLLLNYQNVLLNVSRCIIGVVGFQVKISPRSTRNSLNLTSHPSMVGTAWDVIAPNVAPARKNIAPYMGFCFQEAEYALGRERCPLLCSHFRGNFTYPT